MTYKHTNYSLNTDGRDFVVGDIHGCFDMFNEMLEKIEFDKSIDRMFSVGDLIDRGPDSLACLQLIEEDWFYPVRGNHEDMMFDAVRGAHGFDELRLWLMNGGQWSEASVAKEIHSLCSLVAGLPYFITAETSQGDVGICHAEPPTDNWEDVKNTSDDRLIQKAVWGRRIVSGKLQPKTENVFMTVHGHTPLDEVTRFGNAMFIDTGACFDGVPNLRGGEYTGKLSYVELGKL